MRVYGWEAIREAERRGLPVLVLHPTGMWEESLIDEGVARLRQTEKLSVALDLPAAEEREEPPLTARDLSHEDLIEEHENLSLEADAYMRERDTALAALRDAKEALVAASTTLAACRTHIDAETYSERMRELNHALTTANRALGEREAPYDSDPAPRFRSAMGQEER